MFNVKLMSPSRQNHHIWAICMGVVQNRNSFLEEENREVINKPSSVVDEMTACSLVDHLTFLRIISPRDDAPDNPGGTLVL